MSIYIKLHREKNYIFIVRHITCIKGVGDTFTHARISNSSKD